MNARRHRVRSRLSSGRRPSRTRPRLTRLGRSPLVGGVALKTVKPGWRQPSHGMPTTIRAVLVLLRWSNCWPRPALVGGGGRRNRPPPRHQPRPNRLPRPSRTSRLQAGVAAPSHSTAVRSPTSSVLIPGGGGLSHRRAASPRSHLLLSLHRLSRPCRSRCQSLRQMTWQPPSRPPGNRHFSERKPQRLVAMQTLERCRSPLVLVCRTRSWAEMATSAVSPKQPPSGMLLQWPPVPTRVQRRAIDRQTGT